MQEELADVRTVVAALIGAEPEEIGFVNTATQAWAGDEKVVVRKQLRRSQVVRSFQDLAPCLVGLKACATAHQWARELAKLDVKAYVKRSAADAAAICEAVRGPTMRFVPVKSAAQMPA